MPEAQMNSRNCFFLVELTKRWNWSITIVTSQKGKKSL